MLDLPSCVSSWKMAVSSLLTYSGSTASANLLRLAAAARRTMGVSSWVRSRYKFRSSVLSAVGARRYAVASRPQADTREVNQSPVASRCARARTALSRCCPQAPPGSCSRTGSPCSAAQGATRSAARALAPPRFESPGARLDQRREVLHHALLRQLRADLGQRLDRLLAHHGLLHAAQRLQRRQQRVRVGRPADVRHKAAQLLRHGQQHLVLVVVAVGQERDELLARALLAQRQRNRGQALDRVEPQRHVLVLQLVSAPRGARVSGAPERAAPRLQRGSSAAGGLRRRT